MDTAPGLATHPTTTTPTPATPTARTLASVADVEALLCDATWLGRPYLDAVEIAPALAPHLDDLHRGSAATRIRRLHNDCGCRWGEAALLVAVLLVWPGPLPWSPALVVPFVLLAAVGGKLAGLAHSHRELQHDLRRLAAGAPPAAGTGRGTSTHPAPGEGGRHGRSRVP